MTGHHPVLDALLDRCAKCGRCRGVHTHAGYHQLESGDACYCSGRGEVSDTGFLIEVGVATVMALAAACYIIW